MPDTTKLPEEMAANLADRFENAPFNKKLGVKGVLFERGRAVLALDFADENITVSDIVHGGAIAGLVDCAATAAAWTTIDNPTEYNGITIDLTLNFIASARSSAIQADAYIIRQGRSITYLECTVTDTDGQVISKSLVTYKLSKIRPDF